jgi:hypothetical protein
VPVLAEAKARTAQRWGFALLAVSFATMQLAAWWCWGAVALTSLFLVGAVGSLMYAGGQQHRAFVLRVAGWSALGSPRGDAWRRLLAVEGLGDIPDIVPRVRGAVRISTARVEEVAVGSSRIGGTPDLPAALAWPYRGRAPLHFLAQFDLQDVARALPDSPLPRTGHLWFFHDPGRPFASAVGRATVLYDASGAALQRAIPPVRLPRWASGPLYAVTLESYEDIPDLGQEDWLGQPLRLDRRQRYREIRSYLTSPARPAAQKMLGYANDGYVATQMGSGASDWRLLFQLDFTPDRDISCEADRYVFWIRDQDLRAGRFDQARVTVHINC